jgi:hypothetical protein
LTPFLYRVFNNQSIAIDLMAYGILGLLVGFALYWIKRSPATPYQYLLDFGLTSALSLLAFYHQNYDLFLLIPGLMAIYVYMSKSAAESHRGRWAFFLLAIIVLLTLPGDLLQRLYRSNPEMGESYLWRVAAPFQTWTTFAVLGVLFWLKRRTIKKTQI